MKTIEDEFREMLELPETAPAELNVAFSWQDESDTESLDDETDLPGYDSDWSPSVYPSVQYDRHRERPIVDQLVASLKREAQLEQQLQYAQDTVQRCRDLSVLLVASTTGRVPEAIYDLLTEGSAHAQRYFGYNASQKPHPPKRIRKQSETLVLSPCNSEDRYE